MVGGVAPCAQLNKMPRAKWAADGFQMWGSRELSIDVIIPAMAERAREAVTAPLQGVWSEVVTTGDGGDAHFDIAEGDPLPDKLDLMDSQR